MSVEQPHEKQTVATQLQKLLGEYGVIGFHPEKDAVRITTSSSSQFYYYLEDGEIHWTGRFATGPNTWRSASTMEVEKLDEVLDTSDSFDVVSREAFDYFSNLNVEGVHDGLCWGIVSIYGEKAHEQTLSTRQLKAVPGIGKEFGTRLVKAMQK